MKYYTCIFLFFCMRLAAQSGNKIPEFKVEGKVSGYDIFPSDNYLFLQNQNQVKIVPKEKGKTYYVKVTNGAVKTGKGEGLYIIEKLVPAKTMLSIYEKQKDNSSKLVMNKVYEVVPFPRIKIAGVKCDSAITRIQLAAGSFYAEFKGARIKVSGFKMDMYKNGKFSSDSSVSAKLSPKMLEYISKLKGGSLLYFYDFKFIGTDGLPKTIPVYRVFVTDDALPIKVGL